MDFNEYVNQDYTARLEYFLGSLSTTNRTPDYYVNWEKVNRETRKFELELNTLNYLVGKPDIYEEAHQLFSQQPHLLRAIPSLIASRDKKIDVLVLDETNSMDFFNLDFKTIDTTRLDEYLKFIEDTGLFDFLANHARQNLVDFVYGVETGLDSNARKNRSGTTMENILEHNIAIICEQLSLEHKPQATAKWMKENWGVQVPVDKSERRFDEAVFDRKNNKVFVLETNYYGGGGSKLKAVAGEFKMLNSLINSATDNVQFAWVTDGQGWRTAKLPLEEAFEDIPYVFNLSMLADQYLFELMQKD